MHGSLATRNKVLSEKLNFVLSFLNIPGGLDGVHCAVGGTNHGYCFLTAAIGFSLLESRRAPVQPNLAHATSYSGAVDAQAGHARRQLSGFNEIVAVATSAEQRARERLTKSVIVIGLTPSAETNDKQRFERLCMMELGIEPQVTFTIKTAW